MALEHEEDVRLVETVGVSDEVTDIEKELDGDRDMEEQPEIVAV